MRTHLENFPAFDDDNQTSVRDWKILHQLSIKLLQPDTLEQKLVHILETVAAFHQTSKAVISLMEPMSPTFNVKASIGMNEAAVADLSCIRPGEGCCGYAFSERQRVIVENFAQNDQFFDFRPWAERNEIAAVYSTPFYDVAGEPLGALSVYFREPHIPSEREKELTDMCASTMALILERDRTEKALRAERDRRDKTLYGMAEGLCILNHDFVLLEMNTAATLINRRPLHEMLGKSHWDLWPETSTSEVGRLFRKAMNERVQVVVENRWVDPQGKINWYQLTALPIDEGLAVFIQDITERKKAEQTIADSETRYRVLSESVSEVVWRCDEHGKVVHELPSWAQYSGQTWEEYAGDGLASRIHPDDRDRVSAQWKQSIATGTPFHVAQRLQRHDGIYRHMLTRGVPLRNAQGEIYEWIGNGEDITDMLSIQEQLQLADRRKDEFLAVLSHELRSPLSATKMAAQLLEAQTITPERAKQMGQVITRQVGHMSRLVEDLLDVSRVARGLIRLEQRKVDMEQVIQSAIEQVKPMITAKGHALTLSTQGTTGLVYAIGDYTRLIQVFTNLLSNAARYTPAGGHISILLATTSSKIRVKIIDNGVGIKPVKKEQLFDLFVQAEVSTDRQNGGLGLGLALVKSLVEIHGGNVTASSDGEGLGSTFCVELPLAPDHSV